MQFFKKAELPRPSTCQKKKIRYLNEHAYAKLLQKSWRDPPGINNTSLRIDRQTKLIFGKEKILKF